MKGYTTEEKIENLILTDIDASFSNQIDGWIESVESFIEEKTNRVFIADTSATPRLYDGDNTSTLLIEDCVDVTKVEVGLDSYGGDFLEIDTNNADRYFTKPTNASALGKPITQIDLNARKFPAGTQNNRITAKWGYSVDVPSDIEFATTVFVAGILNQNRQGGDVIKSEKIGNYSVTYDNTEGDTWSDFSRAMEIIDRYKRHYL